MAKDGTNQVSVVASLIKDAIAYRDERSSDRVKAMEYAEGTMADVPAMDGRSKAVSLDVRSAVKKVQPSAVKTILGNEKVVEYQPTREGTEEQSDQATDYVNNVVLRECDGYEAISDAMHDALLLRNGILRVWCDERTVVKVSTHTGLDEQARAQLLADDEVEVLEHSEHVSEPDRDASEPGGMSQQGSPVGMDMPANPLAGMMQPGMPGPDPMAMGMPAPMPVTTHDVKIKRVEKTKEIRCAAVAPDEWIIHPQALSVETALLCGIHKRMRRAELVAMGYDRNKVLAAAEAGMNEEEAISRRNDAWIGKTDSDRMLVEVDYYEVYVRLDQDDDGIAELRRMVFIGGTSENDEFENEYWDDPPFADICSERRPHQWEGKSIADDVMPIQRVKTMLLRQTLDNLYWQNMPQPIVQDGVIINPDSVLKPDFGKPIRIKAGIDARAAMSMNVVPFVAKESFAMLDYMDREITDRTGVSDVSSGMDPKALQNMTATATSLVETAGIAQTELMIRTMAHGLRRFFRIMLKMVVQHQDKPRTVRLRGKWVTFDPRSWDADMDATVNVGLGAGTRERDMMMMQVIMGLQEKLMLAFGKDNPFVKHDDVYNAITQTVAAAGIKTPSLFFTKPDDADIAARMQAESAKPTPEQEKAQAQMQIEAAKAENTRQIEQMKAQMQLQMEAAKSELAMKMKAADMEAQRDKEAAQMQADVHVKIADLERTAAMEAQKMQHDLAKLQMQQKESLAKLQIEQQRREMELQFQIDKHNAEMALKQQELDLKSHQLERDIEFRHADSERNFHEKREAREAGAKPVANVNIDAQGVMKQAADALSQMAQDQAGAMSEAVAALTNAVQKLGGPRKKTAIGPNGKRFEITDEAI